ncbi:MAG: EAL domain-containing protein, partial [Pseudomonadota bacterium]
MLVIISFLASAACGAGAWFGSAYIGLSPTAAAALSVSVTANLTAMCALLVIWRDQGRARTVDQRLERMERHGAATARAIKSLPNRTREMFAPVEDRVAKVERLTRAVQASLKEEPSETDALATEIAAVTSAMNETLERRAATPAPSPAPEPKREEPAQDDLAAAVEGLVARYTKNGRPRTLATPKSVNDDPRPAANQADNRAALANSSSGAERLATMLLRQTIDTQGLKVRLSPICRLPNRRVIWQEAVSQLSGAGGLTPADYLPLAGAAGMMPEHDTHLIRRVVESLRQTPGNMRLFVNMHPSSLTVPGPIDALTQAIANDPAISNRLIIEFSQDTVKTMGKDEVRGLGTLTRLGFDLSMDGVEDLRLDWRAMSRQGFRFVKVPAHILCGDYLGSDVHPADLGALVDRHGMSLIAEGVDGEGT